VIIETEIWPNLLAACEQRGIPCILGNARLSARSAAGYQRFGSFTRQTLGRFSVIAAQGPPDAERFLALGADPTRVQVTGSIKFDLRLPASLHEEAQVLRRLWGADRPVWVAASTHEGEDEPLLAAHRRILEALPASLLVLVPRHPERFDRAAALVARQGLSLTLRSERQPCGPDTQVFLGDSMGELRLFLAAADAAFIGGSLVERGGHNVLEPAALGLPVVFGPHMFNFAEIGRLLVDQGAAVQVHDETELARVMIGWLQDASERARIGELGRQVVARNRGALDRLSGIIEGQLAGSGA
jgi:3-deoxy-D-manno-octulosonic-acid transferase